MKPNSPSAADQSTSKPSVSLTTDRVVLGDPKITCVRVIDLRFPTSLNQIGSDAVNRDPDYSAAYCILETDVGLEGHGLTFTLGRGTELCVMALQYLSRFVKGRY